MTPRGLRRWGRRTAALAAMVLLAGTALPQERQFVRPEDAIVALFSLQTDLEVERKILAREEARYEANQRQRAEIRDRLARMHEEMEALFRLERGETAGEAASERERAASDAEVRQSAEAKEVEVMSLERGETAARDEGRRLRDEIRQIRARIALKGVQLDSLRASLPKDQDSVTGLWEVSLLPSGDKGVFMLWQSGTLVSGQYVLDGPFRGSLEGTLINRQIVLRRIDARLGRSMEFSGYLSADGQRVQGTWLNYDLSSGRSPSGSWTARKRSTAPSEGAAPSGGEPGS